MTKRYRLIKDIETPNYYVYRGQELFRLNDDVLILKATDRFIRPDAIREIHFHEKHEIQKLLGDWFTEIKEEEPEHIFWNGKKYEIKEKSASGTRMILKEVKEESPQNSWSDNDMIEFADDRVERVIKKYFHWTSLSVKHDKEDLESFKNEKPCR